MRWLSAHFGEASGPAVCVDGWEDVPVRLQASFTERLLTVLRWTLGFAGAVVVLWVGAAFLAASPASAAVVVPGVAGQAVLKGGNSRPAGAKNGGTGDNGGQDPKVKKPAQDPKVKKPAQDPKVKKPAQDPKVKKPAQDPKGKKPAQDPKAKKPAQDPKAKKPAQDPKAKKPAQDPKAKKPAQDPKAKKPAAGSGEKPAQDTAPAKKKAATGSGEQEPTDAATVKAVKAAEAVDDVVAELGEAGTKAGKATAAKATAAAEGHRCEGHRGEGGREGVAGRRRGD